MRSSSASRTPSRPMTVRSTPSKRGSAARARVEDRLELGLAVAPALARPACSARLRASRAWDRPGTACRPRSSRRARSSARRLACGRAASSASSAPISASTGASSAIASTPRSGSMPADSTPRLSISNQAKPPCSVTSSRFVCSGRITASTGMALGQRDGAGAAPIPRRCSRRPADRRPGAGPTRRCAGAATSAAARPPFMSATPRPRMIPSRTSGTKPARLGTDDVGVAAQHQRPAAARTAQPADDVGPAGQRLRRSPPRSPIRRASRPAARRRPPRRRPPGRAGGSWSRTPRGPRGGHARSSRAAHGCSNCHAPCWRSELRLHWCEAGKCA